MLAVDAQQQPRRVSNICDRETSYSVILLKQVANKLTCDDLETFYVHNPANYANRT